MNPSPTETGRLTVQAAAMVQQRDAHRVGLQRLVPCREGGVGLALGFKREPEIDRSLVELRL